VQKSRSTLNKGPTMSFYTLHFNHFCSEASWRSPLSNAINLREVTFLHRQVCTFWYVLAPNLVLTGVSLWALLSQYCLPARRKTNIWRAWLCPWTQLIPVGWCAAPSSVPHATCTAYSPTCIYSAIHPSSSTLPGRTCTLQSGLEKVRITVSPETS
jgi:hypothetical protein